MGIERFFSSIEENKIANLDHEFTKTHEDRIHANHFYIDFNSIIHVTSKKILMKLNQDLYKFIKNEGDPKEYLKKFGGETVDKMIIDEVIDSVRKLLEFYIYPEELYYLYIAIDGVPSKSKMMAQKKRRYMGSVISKIRQMIFEKYKEDMKKSDDIRYIFEEYKINWDKSLITPGTEFMHKMHEAMISIDMEMNVKEICKNLKQYKYSSPYEPMEGETKIVMEMRKKENKDKHLIFSPDSDVSLLGLLLSNRISNIKILRHNQQRNNYDVIDVDQLSNNIFKYINKSRKLDKCNVIDDIVFILTIFGNDFLPKMESFDVKHDFDRIIDIYGEVLDEQKKYLINGEKPEINYKFFVKLIKEFQDNEGGNLQISYMGRNYRNYRQVQNALDADQDNFMNKLRKFLKELRKLHSGDIDVSKEFVEQLKKIGRVNSLDQYISRGKRLRVFMPFTKSIRDRFYQIKLSKTLNYLEENMKPTKYDEEVMRFESMLDEYREMLDAKPVNLGKTYIEKDYLKTNKVYDEVKQYYDDFFGVKDINGKKIKEVTQEYIDGLVWVFNHYYGDLDRGKVSTWYFPYNKAPLMTQIYDVVNKHDNDYFTKILERLKKKEVLRKDYFNTVEQLMYVTPAKGLENIMPKAYKKFINSGYYPDLDKLAESFLKGEKVIDCRGEIFLNKCHLEEQDKISDEKFINTLRRIKLDPSVIDRSGIFYDVPRDKIFNYGILVPISNIRNKSKYKYYKKKYLESGQIKYKIKYKHYKNIS